MYFNQSIFTESVHVQSLPFALRSPVRGDTPFNKYSGVPLTSSTASMGLSRLENRPANPYGALGPPRGGGGVGVGDGVWV